jgi:hypothetical protein
VSRAGVLEVTGSRGGLGSDGTALEEPSAVALEVVMSLTRRPGKTALDEGGSYGACSVVDLFSETALGEPFTAAEGG